MKAKRKTKMAKNFFKKVRVSYGDYCWDSHRICKHFESVAGSAPKCSLNLGDLKYDKHMRVLKPKKCASLKKA